MSSVSTDSVIGPVGRNGGAFFSFRPIQKIYKIVISSGGSGNDNPIGMTFFSTNDDGSTDTLTIGGGGTDTNVTRNDMVFVDGEREYLTGISGTFGTFVDPRLTILRSIKITTNQREFGPYGPNVGTSFTVQAPSGNQIVGFLGRSGFYVDALGIYHTRA